MGDFSFGEAMSQTDGKNDHHVQPEMPECVNEKFQKH
jgi:hypothetical protein